MNLSRLVLASFLLTAVACGSKSSESGESEGAVVVEQGSDVTTYRGSCKVDWFRSGDPREKATVEGTISGRFNVDARGNVSPVALELDDHSTHVEPLVANLGSLGTHELVIRAGSRSKVLDARKNTGILDTSVKMLGREAIDIRLAYDGEQGTLVAEVPSTGTKRQFRGSCEFKNEATNELLGGKAAPPFAGEATADVDHEGPIADETGNAPGQQ